MNSKTTALIAAALVSAIGVTAVAQASPGKRDHDRHGGRAIMLMEQFDANSDGQVTQQEIDSVRAERFEQFDTNNDGRLSLEEYEALWLDAMRSRMVDRFQRLDDDGDAVVTVEEFAEPMSNLVLRRDRNDDGAITMDELRRDRKGDRDRD